MRRLLDSNLVFFIESDFVYMPLLLDPSIEREARALSEARGPTKKREPTGENIIIRHDGMNFVKTFNLLSLVNNFKAINAPEYHRMREACLHQYRLSGDADHVFDDAMLNRILFLILPHFIKTGRGLQRSKPSQEALLDFIVSKIDIPPEYVADAAAFLDLQPLENILKSMDDQRPALQPPARAVLTSLELNAWLQEAVQANILTSEYARLSKALKLRRQLLWAKPEHIALFLYIADFGSMEIAGFGFARMKSRGDYLVYKRTGEYVLKDYYGRPYLFPDCRVAVSTYAPARPFVMEKYKHPFLRGYQSNQEICMKPVETSGKPSPETIIRSLEEGITALLYGYAPRRRNGYHSLDKTYIYIPTITFEEYRI